MTVFSTQCCKRFNLLSLGLALLIVFCATGWAASSHLDIKSAELSPRGEQYLLNADFDLSFSPAVQEALSKGLPLHFLMEFQLTKPQRYWFDDEIVTSTSHVSISYHALSRQYLLNIDQQQSAHSTLQEVRERFTRVRNWLVLDKTLLKPGVPYQAALRIRLDASKLPQPLRVDALGSQDWSLISPRYRWTPDLDL